MTVGIQGLAGSYHEAVAKSYFDELVELEYLATFKEVFDALLSGRIQQAVVAIANNRYGFIPEAFSELMARYHEITIVGEAYLPVRHQLLGLEGAKLADIQEVHSQAPALGQCHGFLGKYLSGAQLVEESDTAISAEIVSLARSHHKAAIASREAGRLYGLVVLAPDIQDDTENLTRFFIIQKTGEDTPQECNKTTMLLRTSQTPGSLVDALLPFKEQGINISTLHSAFLPNTGFDMQFLLEFDAAIHDPAAQNVMKQLANLKAEAVTLGTYKAAARQLTDKN